MSQHQSISPQETADRLALRAIYPAFRLVFPNQVIRADDLARAMVDAAVRKTGERRELIFENRDIRSMVELLPHR